jgi:RHS repeat-associated protein
MAYDAEGNILTVDTGGATATYVYNALNQRVKTVANGATTEFVFDASGERVSEWNAATHAQLQGSYYWQGKPLAYYTTAADTSAAVGIHFEHQNYLGTERMRTMPTGPYNSSAPNYAVEASFAEQPFGDNKQTFPGTVIETSFDTDANHYAFLDTDKETATDHADFRQYSNAQGRWMAPDPYDGSYNFGNPQSLNRYVYASNSPLSGIDPSGQLDENGGDSGCTMDGMDMPCSVVNGWKNLGVAVQCPNNNCSFYICPVGSACEYAWSVADATYIASMDEYYDQVAAANALMQNLSCQEQSILNALPGAQPTGDFTAQGGHWEIGITITPDQLAADGFTPYTTIIGTPNGYHNSSLFKQAHINGQGYELQPGDDFSNIQAHVDVFNPAAGYGLGLVLHGIWDLGIGSWIGNSPMLDQGCAQ